jgi:periplasmic mercuric ion binding protein
MNYASFFIYFCKRFLINKLNYFIMNFTKSILALALSGMLFISCKETGSAAKNEGNNAVAATEKTPVSTEKLETASFNIDGMTCSIGCAKTIEKELAGTAGVQKATVDFDKKTATVEFDNSVQTPESLVKIVEEAADGKTYKVSNVHASKDHAMLMPQDQEKEKKETKKAKAKKGDKSADATTASGKPACCSAKKSHCSADEKKA